MNTSEGYRKGFKRGFWHGIRLGWAVAFLVVFAAMLLAKKCHATPTGNQGAWVNPPGFLIQCFSCPDGESDCFQTEPVYIQLDNAHVFHFLQLYPTAVSEVNGMTYKGVVLITVISQGDCETTSILCHWQREDGLQVHSSLRYKMQGGVIVEDDEQVSCGGGE